MTPFALIFATSNMPLARYQEDAIAIPVGLVKHATSLSAPTAFMEIALHLKSALVTRLMLDSIATPAHLIITIMKIAFIVLLLPPAMDMVNVQMMDVSAQIITMVIGVANVLKVMRTTPIAHLFHPPQLSLMLRDSSQQELFLPQPIMLLSTVITLTSPLLRPQLLFTLEISCAIESLISQQGK